MNSFDPEEIFKNTASNHVKTAARRTIHSHRWYRGTFKDIYPHVPGPFSVVTKSYVLIDHCDVLSPWPVRSENSKGISGSARQNFTSATAVASSGCE